jgi:hypothetical protein
MKTETLKIGTKIGTEHIQIEIPFSIPETVEDCATLSKGSHKFLTERFTRGWRIWAQEQSGARDYLAENIAAYRKDPAAMKEALLEIVNRADPLSPPARTGRPAGPRTVEVQKDALATAIAGGDMAALQALLAAQGIKLNIAE